MVNENNSKDFTKKEQLLLEQWKGALELHKHTDQMCWQNFNYLLIINGILFSALGVIWSKEKSIDVFPIELISIFGLIVTFSLVYTQIRAIKYNKYRIMQAKKAEKDLQGIAQNLILDLMQKRLNELNLKWEGKVFKVPLLFKISSHIVLVGLSVSFGLIWLYVGFVL